MPVSAHIGHWYAELLYLGPVLVVVAWLGVSNLREKRRDRREPEVPADEDVKIR